VSDHQIVGWWQWFRDANLSPIGVEKIKNLFIAIEERNERIRGLEDLVGTLKTGIRQRMALLREQDKRTRELEAQLDEALNEGEACVRQSLDMVMGAQYDAIKRELAKAVRSAGIRVKNESWQEFPVTIATKPAQIFCHVLEILADEIDK
jgi:hypothetical protein